MRGFWGKLGRPRCRPRWDTHLISQSFFNWNSRLAATAVRSVKKCRNGQVKTLWLPFREAIKKNLSRTNNFFFLEGGGLSGKVKVTNV